MRSVGCAGRRAADASLAAAGCGSLSAAASAASTLYPPLSPDALCKSSSMQGFRFGPSKNGNVPWYERSDWYEHGAHPGSRAAKERKEALEQRGSKACTVRGDDKLLEHFSRRRGRWVATCKECRARIAAATYSKVGR